MARQSGGNGSSRPASRPSSAGSVRSSASAARSCVSRLSVTSGRSFGGASLAGGSTAGSVVSRRSQASVSHAGRARCPECSATLLLPGVKRCPECADRGSKERTQSKASGSSRTASGSSRSPPPRKQRKPLSEEEKRRQKLLLQLLRQGDDVDVEEVHQLVTGCSAAVEACEKSFGWHPLLFAANSGNDRLLCVLLDAGADVHSRCNHGNTALHVAARADHAQAVALLVGKSADLEAQNAQGWTALMWAAIAGNEDATGMLLEFSASVHARDRGGRTAAMWAARHGHTEIVRSLLSCGIDLSLRDGEGLTVADHADEYIAMRQNLPRSFLVADDEDEWQTTMAAVSSDVDMRRLQIQHGSRSSRGGSQAGGSQQEDPSEALRRVLADAEEQSNRLLAAAQAGDWEAADAALRAGACASMQSPAPESRSALHWAAMQDAAASVMNLVAARANVEARDGLGWTALHHAVHAGSTTTVSVLHYLGANFVAKSLEGDMVHHLAARANAGQMLQLLQPAIASSLDTVDAKGLTGLQSAALRGHAAAVQTLVALRADLSVRDHDGRSVLALACLHGHESVVNVLLNPLEALVKPWPEEDLKELLESLPWVPTTSEQDDRAHKGRRRKRSSSDSCSGSVVSERSGTTAGAASRSSSRRREGRRSGSTTAQRLLSQGQAPKPGSKARRSGPAMGTIHEVASEFSSEGEGPPQHSGTELDDGEASEWSQAPPRSHANTVASRRSKATSRGGGKAGGGGGGSSSSSVTSSALRSGSLEGRSVLGSSPLGLLWAASCHAVDAALAAKMAVPGKSTTTKAGCDEARPPAAAMGLPAGPLGTGMLAAPLQATSALADRDADGATPLALAAASGKSDLLPMLLNLGAPINAPDLEGNTAIMLSAKRGDKPAVQYLLSMKARIDITNQDGKSALSLAKGAELRGLLQDHLDRAAIESKLSRSCSLPSLTQAGGSRREGAAAPCQDAPKKSFLSACRVRVDGLPTRLPVEQLEAHVSKIVRRRRIECPSFVDVAVDPITLKPKGHCFLGFDSEEKAAAAVDCLEGTLDACVECF
eukprot:TRINITY_DN23011_c0_g1_i1.p1 TRINITY_DN23011_c0_g1~~TRINITY_DN23011_c0_g1_i1.p1  ORF type:complete len:1058 (+),score=276.68 TRINITY_DN23011_c0_g1_i1:54-3227(+)